MRAARLLMIPLAVLLLAFSSTPAVVEGEASDVPCVEECGGQAEQVFDACREAGGTEEACMETAADAVHTCVAEHCTSEPPLSCPDRCQPLANEIGAHCLQEFSNENGCALLRDAALERCVEDVCAPAGSACEDRCTEFSHGIFVACIAMGGDDETCKPRADEARALCLAAQCNPGPTCPERCQSAAMDLRSHCTQEGDDPVECAARAAEAARHCIAEDSPPPSCEEICEDHARADSRRCLANGGSRDDCAVQSHASFQECLALHCGDAPPPCQRRCEVRAARDARSRLEHGGTPAQCAKTRNASLQRCLEDRCVPPPPLSCPAACEAHAKEIVAHCRDSEIDAATCEAEGHGALDACLSQCGAAPAPTCAEQCELHARDLYHSTLARHNDRPRATRRAQQTFRRCAQSCPASASRQTSARLASDNSMSNTSGTTSTKSSRLPRCLQGMNSRPLLADYAAYIATHANVQQAMNPCKIPTAILNWFFTKLETCEQTGMPPSAPLPETFSPTSTTSYVLGGTQTDEILGAKLAHIFYIEVRNKVPWRLAAYSSADLKRIFTLCKWPHPCNHDTISDFAAQYVLDYSPRVAWSVVQQNIDLNAMVGQRQAVADILEHTRHFIHGGVYYDGAGNLVKDDSWGIRTLDQMMSEKISRHGCWSMVPYAMQLVAALNIPVDGISDYYAGLGHATALFPMTDQVLAHGDDVYDSLLLDTSTPLILDSFARWQKEVLAYPPGSQSAAYNSDKHSKEMERLYPSAFLMQNYCNQGLGGRLYLESVFKTYATVQELDDLQARLSLLTSNCSVIPPDNP